MLSQMRWGKPITPQQEQFDLDALHILLSNYASIAYWTDAQQQFPEREAKTYLLVRNLGAFRLGCLFIFLEDIPEAVLDKLSDETTPMTLIGHLDKIIDIIVSY